MACKESGGGSLALQVASTAGRTACLCKECGGNGICEHGRVRTSGFWGTIPSYADAPARCGLFDAALTMTTSLPNRCAARVEGAITKAMPEIRRRVRRRVRR